MTNGSATAATSGGNPTFTYAWDNGQTTQTATGLSAGIYSVTITDATGCSGIDTIRVPLVLTPPAGNFSSSPVCLGSSTQFTDNSTGNPNSWSWNFGDGTPIDTGVQSPAHTYSAPGSYSVTLIVTNPEGCSDIVVVPVTVHALPTAAITPSSPCLQSVAQLNDASVSPQGDPISSWNWNMTGGNPNTSTTQNPTTSYTTAGTHTVTLVVTTKAGCKDSIDAHVLVHTPPIANFTGGGTVQNC